MKSNVKESVQAIKKIIGDFSPRVAIICGSGLGAIGQKIEKLYSIDYNDIPHFQISAVKGHAGKMLFGRLGDKTVVCMQGRFHPYEGITPAACSMPVWVMKELGATTLIVTAATGSLNPEYNVGDIVIIKDHLNFALFGLHSPLNGPNDDSVGPRFPSLVDMYSPRFIEKIVNCAKSINLQDVIRSGVYIFNGGPTYETIAEARAFRMLGGDVAGMSIVHETTLAAYLGMNVIGLALVSNKICTEYDQKVFSNHDEVLEVSAKRAVDITALLEKFLSQMDE
ncbi:hypothetical protein GJ496_005785 [Pomphorhynchus laevis]|nr:hypothetical protein GJ496_005785 [Pomphorhynchus laevis]